MRKLIVSEFVSADGVLTVFPIILGSGKRLFPDDAADKTFLKLAHSTTFDLGVAVHA
jgi:dihydrofolate reductase